MSKKTLIIAIVAGVLLLAAAVGATLFFTGAFSSHGTAVPVAPATPQTTAAPAAAPSTGPIYLPIEPAFVVNIEDGALVRFLQIQTNLMSHDQAVIDSVDKYLPRINNDLILLFSAVKMDEIRTAEGRQALQQQALDAVNKVLIAETGRGGVEAVYFTKLVVQ